MKKFLLLIFFVMLLSGIASATTYYISTSGSDSAAGTSNSTPWRNISKVSALTCVVGDKVLFRRGDTWRFPNETYITPKDYCEYGSYSTGAKPRWLGSNISRDTLDWTNVGGNTWKYFQTSTSEPGNLIFTDSWTTTNRVWHINNMTAQGDYFFNGTLGNKTLYMYSTDNPVTHYGNIEIAYTRGAYESIVYSDTTDYNRFENITFAYGGGHAMNFHNAVSMVFINNTFTYIGGGNFTYSSSYPGQRQRYGNGINSWQGSDDWLIQWNNFSEIIDAAVTPQYTGSTPSKMNNWTVINNTFRNIGYCWEQIQGSSNNNISNMTFQHNTCVGIGSGWYQNQRPQTSGPKCFRIGTDYSTEPNRNMVFKDNICQDLGSYYSYYNGYIGFMIGGSNPVRGGLSLSNYTWDYNIYYNYSANHANFSRWNDASDYYTTMAAWIAGTGQDTHSQEINPQLKNVSDFNFRPYSTSPGCGQASDGSDIGAWACEAPAAPDIYLPYYTTISNNGSLAILGSDVTFTAALFDNENLSYYKFSSNNTGSWVNASAVDISGNTSYSATATITTAQNAGKTICGLFYFNDTSNNANVTEESCYTVQSSPASSGCTLDYFTNFTNAHTLSSVGYTTTSVNYEICQNFAVTCNVFDRITPQNCVLNNVVLHTGDTATQVILKNGTTTLGTYSVNSTDKKATIGMTLSDSTNGEYYSICTYAGGSAYNMAYKTGVATSNSTYSQWIGGTMRGIQTLNLTVYNTTGTINVSIIADSIITGSRITNFTTDIAAIFGTYNLSTSTGRIVTPICGNETNLVNFTTKASSFSTNNTFDVSIPSINPYNYLFYLQEANSLLVDIYHENTYCVLDAECFTELDHANYSIDFLNIKINLYNDDYAFNASTENGTYQFTDIPVGTYTIMVIAYGYATRLYTIDITDTTASSIDLYILQMDVGQYYRMVMKDENYRIIEGFTVIMERYFTALNGYVQVDMSVSDLFGLVQFAVVPNDAWYKFIIKDRDGNVVQEWQPMRIYDATTEKEVIVQTGVNYFASIFKMKDVYTNLFQVNVSNTSAKYHFTFSDSAGLVAQGCISVYKQSIIHSPQLVCNSCLEASSGTVICEFDRVENSDYTIKGIIETNTGYSNYTTDFTSLAWNADIAGLTANERGFYAFMIIMVLSIIGMALGGFDGIFYGMAGALVVISVFQILPIHPAFIALTIFLGLIFTLKAYQK